MSEKGDAGGGNRPDLFGASLSTFEFDCIRTRTDQAAGALDGEFAAVVAMDREVSDDKCRRDTSRDSAGVIDDLFDLHAGCVRVTKHRHSQGIAHQDDFDAT